jgi:hypothetical protein
MGQVARRRFEEPDETRTLEHANMMNVKLAGSTAARATLQPGWSWAGSVKPVVGTDSCEMHHIGYALSGTLHVKTDEGEELDISTGDVYEILPGHEAWVVGDEPFEGLEFQSQTAQEYGRPS